MCCSWERWPAVRHGRFAPKHFLRSESKSLAPIYMNQNVNAECFDNLHLVRTKFENPKLSLYAAVHQNGELCGKDWIWDWGSTSSCYNFISFILFWDFTSKNWSRYFRFYKWKSVGICFIFYICAFVSLKSSLPLSSALLMCCITCSRERQKKYCNFKKRAVFCGQGQRMHLRRQIDHF